MNYLDIAIVVPLLYGLVKGFSNGLIKEITGLLSLIIGIYIAVNFSILLESCLSGIFGYYEQFKPILAFAILFVATILIIKLIGSLANKLTKALALGFISRILGAIFGGIKIILIFCFLLLILKEHKFISDQIQEESVLLKPINDISVFIMPEINKHKEVILDKVEKNTKKVKGEIEKKANSQ